MTLPRFSCENHKQLSSHAPLAFDRLRESTYGFLVPGTPGPNFAAFSDNPPEKDGLPAEVSLWRALRRHKGERWSRQQDLNPRPTDYKSVALPTELCRRLFFSICVYFETNLRRRHTVLSVCGGKWSGKRDSNPQPTAWKAVALAN